MERKQWFINRINKRVYRNKVACNCPTCKDVYKNGVIIDNLQHAICLYGYECDYNIKGFPLKYFDTKKEANEFELTLKK